MFKVIQWHNKMRKVLKINESDITRIVEKVVDKKSPKDKVMDMISNGKYLYLAKNFGGYGVLNKMLGVGTPEDYLNLFNDLREEVFGQNPKWGFLVDKNGTRIVGILRYPNGTRVKVYHNVIWNVLEKGFNINNYNKIRVLIQNWLKDGYGIDSDWIEPVARMGNYGDEN